MIRVNLQPKIRLEKAEGFQLHWFWAVLLGVIVFGAMGFLAYQFSWQLTQSNSKIRSLDFELKDFQKIIKEYEDAVDEKNYLQGKRDFVKGISENQHQWISFFEDFKKKMPKDVYVTRLDIDRNGAYTMEGGTFSYSAIGYFMLQLNSIPFISSTTLESAGGGAGGGDDTAILAKLTKIYRITGGVSMEAARAPTAATSTTPVPGAAPVAPGAVPTATR
jgi:Tfp pilus assembly protein PilN